MIFVRARSIPPSPVQPKINREKKFGSINIAPAEEETKREASDGISG